jgi:hypothetical protein
VFNFAGLSIHESSNFAATFSSPFLPAFRAAQSQGIAAPIAHPIPVSSRDGSLLSAIIEYKVISQAPSIHQANILPKVHLAPFKRFQAFQIIQGAFFIAHFASHPHIAVCAISHQIFHTWYEVLSLSAQKTFAILESSSMKLLIAVVYAFSGSSSISTHLTFEANRLQVKCQAPATILGIDKAESNNQAHTFFQTSQTSPRNHFSSSAGFSFSPVS